MYPGTSFKVTNCVGNLLKSIDNNPAAKYLEGEQKLMSIDLRRQRFRQNQETKQYKKLRGLKVTAVDGEPRLTSLLSHQKLNSKEAEIQFLWSPQKIGICQIITTTRLLNLQTHSLLPTPYEETSYNENTDESQHIYENVLVLAVNRVLFNDVKHNSPGESVSLKLEKKNSVQPSVV